LTTFASQIREGQLTGTLEATLMSPAPLPLILLYSSLWSYAFSAFRFLLYVVAGGVLYGVSWRGARPGAALAIFVVTVLCFAGAGILWAKGTFASVDLGLVEIAYTEADEARRQKMWEIRDAIIEDLLQHFPGLTQTSNSKYGIVLGELMQEIPKRKRRRTQYVGLIFRGVKVKNADIGLVEIRCARYPHQRRCRLYPGALLYLDPPSDLCSRASADCGARRDHPEARSRPSLEAHQ